MSKKVLLTNPPTTLLSDADKRLRFKRIAELLGICPFAKVCVTTNYYWYREEDKEGVKEYCSTSKHASCAMFGILSYDIKEGVLDEAFMEEDVKKHPFYRKWPVLRKLETLIEG
jgi:hypothetical protein